MEEEAGVLAGDGAEAIMEAIRDIPALAEEVEVIRTTEEEGEADTTDTVTTRPQLMEEATMPRRLPASSPAPRPLMVTAATRDSEDTEEATAAPAMEAGGTLNMVTTTSRGQPGPGGGRRGQRGQGAQILVTTNTNMIRVWRSQRPELRRGKRRPRPHCRRRITDFRRMLSRTLVLVK